MFPLAHRFAPGHRVAIAIRSDWFPRFARNLNTWESPAEATGRRTATQTLHLGGPHPSVLQLPVLPPEAQR